MFASTQYEDSGDVSENPADSVSQDYYVVIHYFSPWKQKIFTNVVSFGDFSQLIVGNDSVLILFLGE